MHLGGVGSIKLTDLSFLMLLCETLILYLACSSPWVVSFPWGPVTVWTLGFEWIESGYPRHPGMELYTSLKMSFVSVGRCSICKLNFKVGPVLIQTESIVKVQNDQDLETWYYVTTSAVSRGRHFPHWITLPVSHLCFVWLLYPV